MSDVKSEISPSVLALEAQRVREVFSKRKDPDEGPFDLFRLYEHQDRQRALVHFFRQMGLSSLKRLRILDVGCGSGGQLRRLTDFGAEPQKCFGIDLFAPSLVSARGHSPNMAFLEGSAAQLPFASDAFDLIFQFTVFSSVLDSRIRRAMAFEIQRVLRPGGYFIWYDFAYSNYKNPYVRGIGKREIRQLFDGFDLSFQRVTLAPPIGRPAAKISLTCYRALAAIPILRTHYLYFVQKPG